MLKRLTLLEKIYLVAIVVAASICCFMVFSTHRSQQRQRELQDSLITTNAEVKKDIQEIIQSKRKYWHMAVPLTNMK